IIPSVLFNGILDIFKKNDLESSLPIPVSTNREEKISSKNYNVLVVEDNKTNQFIAKSILEQVGVTVVLTDNGEEGASYYKLHASTIDLILMDLHMPVLNGYEATLRIRMYDSEVPIVAMTADAITGIEEQCKRVGINHYISKPFEPEKFIDTILDLLDQHASAIIDSKKDSPEGSISKDKKELQLLPQIIQEDALKLLGNNLPLYHMVLKEYRKENTSTCEELATEIQNNNYLVAAQIVHKAKGSSGNVGAKELHSVAALLQKALENNQQGEISKLYPEFIRLMKQGLIEIDEILSS
ncbi:MAG: response regulator, partial [Mobilitalea sp.]